MIYGNKALGLIELEDEIIITVVATGFDSEYYRDDPRAQEYGHTGIETSDHSAATPVVEAPAKEPSQTMADPVKEAEKHADDMKPESQSADFAEATTVNMWDNIRTDSGSSDDSDIPAILRRRKKNKN